MNYSRRDLSLLLPALLAPRADGEGNILPSECFAFNELPVKTNPQTHNESRQVLHGETHTGYPIDLHITRLAPGQMPHPPHHHEHEEMMLIQEGMLEFTIAGVGKRIGPGSVAYVHSNEEHGLKNVGDVMAQYFVLAFGQMA
jgi:mannose-6-phosphate isomerase-like protein (cupin superfamily)